VIIARDGAPVAGTRNRATGRPWVVLPSRHRAARISLRGPGIPDGANLVYVRTRFAPVVSVVPFTDDLSPVHARDRRASRASQSSGIQSASISADVSIIAAPPRGSVSLFVGFFSSFPFPFPSSPSPGHDAARILFPRASGNDNSPISVGTGREMAAGYLKAR